MVGPIVDSGYEGICNTPSVNFTYKTLVKWVSKEVLHLQNQSQNSVFQRSENLYSEKFFSGPNHGGPYSKC